MSHLREHKFKHNFQDCLNPICSCGLDIESTSHFLLRCPKFNEERYTFLSTLNKIDCKLATMLYGNTLFAIGISIGILPGFFLNVSLYLLRILFSYIFLFLFIPRYFGILVPGDCDF